MRTGKLLLTNSSSHTWSFSRVGGVNRVNIETGNDLVNLESLDQKLWTALSCAAHGLEIDSKTLELIDTDNDGKIRVPEIIAAVKWLVSAVKNPDTILCPEPYLKLNDINDQTEEGQNLLESAKQILNNLGKHDSGIISVEDTSDTIRIFAGSKFNGDGIITDMSAGDETIKTLIAEIISCMGSVADRNGEAGITAGHVTDFYKLCEEYSCWQGIAEANPEKITPFGEQTPAALAAYLAVKEKIEDYFLRCRLLSYGNNSAEILSSIRSSCEGISKQGFALSLTEIETLPIALPDCGNLLAICQGLNPAWEKPVAAFNFLVVQNMFPGKTSLQEGDMASIENIFEGFIAWQSAKNGTTVERLGLKRIREILAQQDKREMLEALISQDKAFESSANGIMLVDKLVRYNRDLFKLLRNYVTFYDFYSPGTEAVFQAGWLYFDQRRCDLCMKVIDMAKHNQLAKTSGLCLIYCDCVRKQESGKITIVAAITDGDFDNIDVGRNGIFYDRSGNDWDASIVKVIDNPISIRQAFWSPYRKLSKLINTQIEKFASAKEEAIDTAASSGVEKVSGDVNTGLKDSAKGASVLPKPPSAQPFDIGKFVGIFAALSLALGAIGSALTSIFTGLLSISLWKIPIAIFGIILAISGPSMVIAWLKLRKRNLAPLLDSNGWAVKDRKSVV
jgi:Ca2+-binding EF-hand superfamily protein